jgi:hypothetical protein
MPIHVLNVKLAKQLLAAFLTFVFACTVQSKTLFDVTAAVAAAPARKSEAWLTWLVRTAELGDCEESSTLAWAWH